MMMKKWRPALLPLLLLYCCLALTAFSPSQAQAAQDASSALNSPVMVLPFQINASPEVMSRLNLEFPDLLMQRLIARGLTVMGAEEVYALLER